MRLVFSGANQIARAQVSHMPSGPKTQVYLRELLARVREGVVRLGTALALAFAEPLAEEPLGSLVVTDCVASEALPPAAASAPFAESPGETSSERNVC